MDSRTRYSRVSKLLEPIVGETIEINKLKNRIRIEIGSSETLIQECIRLAIDLDLIREVDHLVFKVLKCKANI